MNKTVYIILVIVICSIINYLLRALPFLIFRGKEAPDPIKYLGKVLPMAVMASLVVYCIKNVDFGSINSVAPQFIAMGATALLHLWKRNVFLSIFGGTAIYMVLIQVVF